MSVRVLIVDDHAIVREGLRTVLADEPDIELVGEADRGSEALALVQSLRPDVVLLDLVMPGMDGIEVIRRIRASSPGTRLIVLTSFSDDWRVFEAVRAGATGYLLKDVLKPELTRAIHAAARGEPVLHPEAQRGLVRKVGSPDARPLERLTERELDVLRLIARGCSNKEIASILHLSEGTVKGYVSIVLDKLDVEDRTQAALYAVRHGLAPVE